MVGEDVRKDLVIYESGIEDATAESPAISVASRASTSVEQAVEIIQVLSFVVPGAFTLSLPVAGLFSAAITYGRFAADNELNACRASGINVHRH